MKKSNRRKGKRTSQNNQSDQSVEKLPEKTNRVLRQLQNLPKDQQQIILSKTVSLTASYTSGPLPKASEIERYDEIIPNGADRIMKMAEKQLDHNAKVKDRESRTDRWVSISGQIFGFVVAIVMIMASAYLISIGKEMAGGIFGGTLIIGLVSLFLNRKKLSDH